MSAPMIPVHWILEYAVKNPDNFKEEFIERLLDNIASDPEQPPLPPIVIVALLKRIFSIKNTLNACDPDMSIHETIEYLESLEKQRTRRIKALERRGGLIGAEFIKTSPKVYARYAYALTGLKYWTVYNEISRVPYNPHNTLPLIALLFPEDPYSQSQSEESSPHKPSSDAHRRIEMTSLVSHISKGLASMTPEQRASFDASQHPTLLKNQQKMSWNKVLEVLFTYLNGIEVLFERSEILINPERRIQGLKIDEKIIRTAAEALQKEAGY